MASTGRFTPPDTDEIEVSVFGPGRGECIVVHAPGDIWFVVDSFNIKGRDGRSSPLAEAYLADAMSVEELYGLFLTHWHEDHTQGAAALIERFSGSLRIIGLPLALKEEAFAAWVLDLSFVEERYKKVKDITKVVSVLENPPAKGIRTVALVDSSSLAPDGAGWTLQALSPSFAELRSQAETLKKFLPGYDGVLPKSYDVNASSSVLRFVATGLQCLLGSDLPTGEDDAEGWRRLAVQHKERLGAHILKVPHHGSETSYCEQALGEIREYDSLFGAIAPFPARGAPLPRRAIVDKYRNYCTRLHQTRPPRDGKKAGKSKLNDTKFKKYIPSVTPVLDGVGQIRYRKKPGDASISIMKFGPATEL